MVIGGFDTSTDADGYSGIISDFIVHSNECILEADFAEEYNSRTTCMGNDTAFVLYCSNIVPIFSPNLNSEEKSITLPFLDIEMEAHTASTHDSFYF